MDTLEFNGNEPVAASPQNLVSRLLVKRPNMGGIVEDQARVQAKSRRETAAKQSEDKCLEPGDTDAGREAHTAAAANSFRPQLYTLWVVVAAAVPQRSRGAVCRPGASPPYV